MSGVQARALSASAANSGIKRGTTAAAPDNLEFRSPTMADVDPIADLLVGTQKIASPLPNILSV